MQDPIRPLLVTHSGKFHCDEVFAYVVLRLGLGLREAGVDHTLSRTRAPDGIAAGDWVWDVGSVYDPVAHRFDHHQRGAPERDDGTPYSSAGLVWQALGEAAVAALLPQGARDAAAIAIAIARKIDGSMVRRIDALDNGVAAERDTLGLASLIGEFNPSWDAEPGQSDAAFLQAAALAEGVLRRRVEAQRAQFEAESVVLAAHAASVDARILVMERGMPWQNTVFAHDLPVVYAVYPVSNGNWMVDSMPPEPGSFAQRKPLPAAWAGLQEAALAEASGVPDAVFMHVRRFVGAARSRAGAVALARKAVDLP